LQFSSYRLFRIKTLYLQELIEGGLWISTQIEATRGQVVVRATLASHFWHTHIEAAVNARICVEAAG
jgi:hypothetical protein